MKTFSATLLGLLLLSSAGISGEPTKPETAEVYFSPQGDFPKALVKNLMSAKKSVDIAMYSFFPSSKKDAKDYKTLRRNFITLKMHLLSSNEDLSMKTWSSILKFIFIMSNPP